MSCGGGDTTPSINEDKSVNDSLNAGDDQYFDLKSGELISYGESYRRLETQPGVAGVDYDASRIMVTYLQDAPSLKGSSQQLGTSAATSQGNTRLKRNSQFVAWTDLISSKIWTGNHESVVYRR